MSGTTESATRYDLEAEPPETAILRSKKVKKVQQRPITLKSFLRAFTFWKLWVFASESKAPGTPVHPLMI